MEIALVYLPGKVMYKLNKQYTYLVRYFALTFHISNLQVEEVVISCRCPICLFTSSLFFCFSHMIAVILFQVSMLFEGEFRHFDFYLLRLFNSYPSSLILTMNMFYL